MRPGARGKGKFESQWEEGIWYDVSDRTGEVTSAMRGGGSKATDVRSREEGAAWDAQAFNGFRGTPWEPVPEDRELNSGPER